MSRTVTFMSTSCRVAGKNEVLTAVANSARVRIATLNPEFMLLAQRSPAFQQALESMTHCTIDGFGLQLFLRFAGEHAELYHGADLVADLLQKYADASRRFFLLGGVGTEKAVETLREQYPRLVIEGAAAGVLSAEKPEITPGITAKITAFRPDILLVGFGAPKQELWIAAQDSDIPVMIGVGGTIDFYNRKRRAPSWLRRLHLEWLYRSFSETGHWRRAFRATLLFPLHATSWLLFGQHR